MTCFSSRDHVARVATNENGSFRLRTALSATTDSLRPRSIGNAIRACLGLGGPSGHSFFCWVSSRSA